MQNISVIIFSFQKNINGITFSRNSSFKSSEICQGSDKHPKVEIIKNPPEWVHVEALLAPKTVPIPTPKAEYRSAWKPPTTIKGAQNYMIYRNKNKMMPVYLRETHRGLRKITVVRRVDGDIWELHNDLKRLVETSTNKEVLTRVNELSSQVQLRGDFVQIVNDFLLKKGF